MGFRTDLGEGLRRHTPTIVEASLKTVSPSELTASCLEIARDLGFIRAGVASLEPFASQEVGLREFINRGYHGTMNYLATEEDGVMVRRDPRLFAEAKCALVVALPYPAAPLRPRRLKSPSEVPAPIAAYALGADYHLVIKDKLLCLADRIADRLGAPVLARACVDTAPLLERELAVRAGVVFIAKNTLGISPGAGSHFLLGELLLDIDLESAGELLSEGCGSCRACLDACPTEAFVDAYLLDARRCISYLTIESSEDIPEELRASVGERIFGCDECQSVCPYNQAGPSRPAATELAALPHLSEPKLLELLQNGSSAHRRFVKGTALRRVSRDQLARNVAVALGNRGSSDAIEALSEAARNHRSEQVRDHAKWALTRLAQVHPEARLSLDELTEDDRGHHDKASPD